MVDRKELLSALGGREELLSGSIHSAVVTKVHAERGMATVKLLAAGSAAARNTGLNTTQID